MRFARVLPVLQLLGQGLRTVGLGLRLRIRGQHGMARTCRYQFLYAPFHCFRLPPVAQGRQPPADFPVIRDAYPVFADPGLASGFLYACWHIYAN